MTTDERFDLIRKMDHEELTVFIARRIKQNIKGGLDSYTRWVNSRDRADVKRAWELMMEGSGDVDVIVDMIFEIMVEAEYPAD